MRKADSAAVLRITRCFAKRVFLNGHLALARVVQLQSCIGATDARARRSTGAAADGESHA